jgi:tetratricopeptide (TPR) repeat protein
VAENPRIEELRRRVLKDRASIAFAQLAEEYRRAGRFHEAIDTCRTGLSHHPGYLSAHVTLGRALIEIGETQLAEDELRRVLTAAPENLAAIKGLADIHHRRGELEGALEHYKRALEFAPHDPDLEHLVAQLTRTLEPIRQAPAVPGGLSFEEAVGEFLAHNDRTAPADVDADRPDAEALPSPVAPVLAVPTAAATVTPPRAPEPAPESVPEAPAGPPSAPAATDTPSAPYRTAVQVDALERWLDAILADRDRRA